MDRFVIAALISMLVLLGLSAMIWANWHNSHRKVNERRHRRETERYEQAMAEKSGQASHHDQA